MNEELKTGTNEGTDENIIYPVPQNEEIIKEFWERFVKGDGSQELKGNAKEMLDFLLSALQETESRIRGEVGEMIEGMKRTKENYHYPIWKKNEGVGYNQALTDLLTLLTKNNEDNR